MRGILVWIKAVRVPFFTATVVPIALGAAAAWHECVLFKWPLFWLTLAGGILVHAATNLANDYFDHISGCDEANPHPTPFSGGSRVIQEKLIPAKRVLWASLLCFAASGLIGLYLNARSGGRVVLILGGIGFFLAFFYTAKPFAIGYGTLGECAVGIGFGPLMVAGSYYVQAGRLAPHVFLISLPVAVLIALVLYINEFPDYRGDASVGKRHLVVVLGKKRAVGLYHFFLWATYVCVALLLLFRVVPVWGWLVFLSLPLAWKAFRVSGKNFEKVFELLPANAATIALHSLIGALLIAGFAIDRLVRGC